jgi:hypothetical protein
MNHLVFALSLFLISTVSKANESVKFQAESMLREGNAIQTLEFLEVNKLPLKEDLLIRARAHYLSEDFEKSFNTFKKILLLDKKPEDAVLMRFAQLNLKMNRPKEALRILKKIKKSSIKRELLFSQSLWDLNNKEKAYDHLAIAPKVKNQDQDLIERQKLYYLFNLGRFKKFFETSKDYLQTQESSVEFGLYGVSLLKVNNRYLAELYFDLVLSLKKDNDLLLKERGVFELEAGHAFVASLYLDRAAHLNKEHSFEAAAVHLDLSHHEQALFFNKRVSDPKKKILQQFTIYLDSEDYEKALSLKHELQKRELLKDDKISYALMYSAFKVRDYITFTSLITSITSKNYLSKVLKLKEIVDSCKKSVGLQCVFS